MHIRFGPDNYSHEMAHEVYQPEGHLHKLGRFACYDPAKDLVVPPMFSPDKYPHTPMLGEPTRERDIFGFFRGRMLHYVPKFSRGIRQALFNASRDGDWWGKHRISINESGPVGDTRSYSQQLASSVFCLTIMGAPGSAGHAAAAGWQAAEGGHRRPSHRLPGLPLTIHNCIQA